jgi:glutamate--cysteine ligase regulatory subunit
MFCDQQIVEGIALILNEWQQNQYLKVDNNIAFISHSNNGLNTNSIINERQSIRITVKIFTFDCNDCDSVTNAVDIVLRQLNIESIDSLILSLPSSSSKLSLDQMKPFWKCAQNIVSNGKASQLGISDLDTNQLMQLYEWAQTSKPTTNHINLEACCVIPPEMSAYAKQNNIQLLTHNDPKGNPFFNSISFINNSFDNVFQILYLRRDCIQFYRML